MRITLAAYCVTFFLLFNVNQAFAKNIDLYDEPKDNAKKIGTLDSEVGIIPIFSPKDSHWIKVADPRNGNTGWVKSNALVDTHNGLTEFSYTQKIIDNKSGTQNYPIIQFGNAKPLTPAEFKALYEKYQAKTLLLQKDMQKILQDTYKDVQMIFPNLPMIMPVVVMPQVPEVKSAPSDAVVKKMEPANK